MTNIVDGYQGIQTPVCLILIKMGMEIGSTGLFNRGGYLGVGALDVIEKWQGKISITQRERRVEKRKTMTYHLVFNFRHSFSESPFIALSLYQERLTKDIPRVLTTSQFLVTHTHRSYLPRNACGQRNKGCCYEGGVLRSARQDHYWTKRKGKSLPCHSGI